MRALIVPAAAFAVLLTAACGGGEEPEVSLTLTPDLSQLPLGTTAADMLEETADVLRHRAALYGIEEPQVNVEGEAIAVTLKGIGRESAAGLLTTKGGLEFRREQVTDDGLVVCKTLEGEEFGVPPLSVNPDDTSGSLARCFSLDRLGEPVWVPAEVNRIGGEVDRLTSAYVNPGGWEYREDGSLAVHLTPEGAELLEIITRAITGYHLGFFVDGELVAAPRVQRAITNGIPVLSGVAPERARVLAAVMNAGPLPVPLAAAE